MTHTESISISYTNIRSRVMMSLSVIGKRTPSKDEPAFTTFTVSSAEEPLLAAFIKNAAHNIVAKIKRLVHNLVEDDSTISFDVVNSRWDADTDDSFADSFSYSAIAYCVSSATADYLALVSPQHAQAYSDNAKAILIDILNLCYYKQPSVSSVSPENGASATVTTNSSTNPNS